MLSPEYNRSLIRIANRDRLNATEVENLLEFGTGMIAFTPDIDPEELLDIWKESFDA